MSSGTTQHCGRHECSSPSSSSSPHVVSPHSTTVPHRRIPFPSPSTSNSFLCSGVGAVRLRPCLSVLFCLLLTAASVADAFSVRWDQPVHHDPMDEEAAGVPWDSGDYDGAVDASKEQAYDGANNESTEEDGSTHVDQYINVLKRWGHVSRFPWKRLPNGMCFRKPCSRDRECCRRYNLCDRSARVCIDCWYGSKCRSERDCCMNYPYCQRSWKTDRRTGKRMAKGRCVNKL